jgi:hypothetical protein
LCTFLDDFVPRLNVFVRLIRRFHLRRLCCIGLIWTLIQRRLPGVRLIWSLRQQRLFGALGIGRPGEWIEHVLLLKRSERRGFVGYIAAATSRTALYLLYRDDAP